jgi:hypothetical protein
MTWACGCICLVALASWRYWRWNGLIARGRPIPTLASISNWLIEDKLESLAG